MAFDRRLALLLSFLFIFPAVHSQSLLKLATEDPDQETPGGFRRLVRTRNDGNDLYCQSWRFTVETNDAGEWSTVPRRCLQFVKDYVSSDRYRSESDFVASHSLAFARSVNLSADGKDCWVFDVDETLLSNMPYYALHGFGSEPFDENSFDEWSELADAPALSASLGLYNELHQLGFTIFLLTGRSEPYRNATEKNLLYAGFRDWKRLILRGPSDDGTPAIVYKSKKRQELVDEGYRIRGNSGDQWSDLLGYAVAERSFKLPNPLYFIS